MEQRFRSLIHMVDDADACRSAIRSSFHKWRDGEEEMGKKARNAHREAERAAAQQATARAKHRRKSAPYWIGAGIVMLAMVIVIPLLFVESNGSASGLNGLQVFAEPNHQHVTTSVTYNRTPPAGGNHSATWQNCGVYDQPIQNENAVHSLEHGAVWITYRPTLPADSAAQLQLVARSSEHVGGPQGYVLVSPYPGLHSAVVASAWGAQIDLSGPDDPRLSEFIARYQGGNQGGEKGGECTGGTGTPVA
jgi:hypothetical protein